MNTKSSQFFFFWRGRLCWKKRSCIWSKGSAAVNEKLVSCGHRQIIWFWVHSLPSNWRHWLDWSEQRDKRQLSHEGHITCLSRDAFKKKKKSVLFLAGNPSDGLPFHPSQGCRVAAVYLNQSSYGEDGVRKVIKKKVRTTEKPLRQAENMKTPHRKALDIGIKPTTLFLQGHTATC